MSVLFEFLFDELLDRIVERLFWRRKPKAKLISGTPNFGPSHVSISIQIRNEGNRTYEAVEVEAEFDDGPGNGETLKGGIGAFKMPRTVNANEVHQNEVLIPLPAGSQEWTGQSGFEPAGELRVGLLDGEKVKFTSWASCSNGAN